ncbi:MAG: hypothetical protein HZA50_12630 [Planctomycetes bacterium]|nr:hypothetical protein [Planctomycetota bacterium]
MIFGDWVDEPLKRALQNAGLANVDGAFAYDAGQDLVKPGLAHRRRTRITLTDDLGRIHALYLKRYERPALSRRFRRLLADWRWRSEAIDEFDNITLAGRAGVPPMRAAAAGCRGGRSFIIVTAVPGDALERCCDDFLVRHAGDGKAEELARRLTELVKKFHAAGMVHRDLYSSHVFMHDADGGISLSLIDLARAFRPCLRRFRWQVKDLAQLKYSMPARWVERFWPAFLAGYLSGGREDKLARWNKAIDARVAGMTRRAGRKRPRAGPA